MSGNEQKYIAEVFQSNYIAPVGAKLERGSVLFEYYTSINDTDLLNAKQQIASSNASIAQAELVLENLNAPPTPAQIASADAAIAQAELDRVGG